MRHPFWPAAFLCLATLACAQRGDADLVAVGRRVYLAEGCINCHSQYARPTTLDIERWGPGRPLATVLEQSPPLFGNRRQGPDLQNVGSRRSHEWQRLHLMAPRRITPGSRMPSYAHLFADGDPRGEALVAYLDSLGEETGPARVDWTLPVSGDTTDFVTKQRLFTQWCASCHGETGRGDGPLAGQLAARPRSLATGPRYFVPAGASPAAERTAFARLIKFGMPGTAMAGHEYLSDTDVMALAAYVQVLREPQEKFAAQP